MKFSISRLVTCLLMGCAVVPPYADYQQQYFPDGVNDVYLGMTYQFMSKTREGTNLVPIALGADSTILTYEEVHPDKDFDRIIYSFENSGDQLLFEMAIEYPDNLNPEEVAAKLYGSPNSDEGEWYFADDRKENRLSIWVKGQQLVISDRQIREAD